MTIRTEGARTAEFILSEANGYRSRDVVAVNANGVPLSAGAILGGPVGGKLVAYDGHASDGSEHVAGIMYASQAANFDGDAVVFIRDGEVKRAKLVYFDLNATVVADLAALGLIVRD